MSSKSSKKQRKKQAALAAAASAFGSGLAEDVPERGTRRNQAIGHGAITIQPDILEMHAKKRKSTASLSRSRTSKSNLKSSKNAPVATVLSNKSAIELVSSSLLLQVQLSTGSLKRIRFELKDTVAHCLKHAVKHDKELQGELFATAGGIWLDGGRTLGSYNLEELEVLEVRPRPLADDLLKVSVMLPLDSTLDYIEIEPSLATGRGILQSILNKPKTFDLRSSALFFQRAGVWLDNSATAMTYELVEDDALIYGERTAKKIGKSDERLKKQDVPPLISSMSEASLLHEPASRPGRALSSALSRTSTMDAMKMMAVTRANSTETSTSAVEEREPEVRKAFFAEPEKGLSTVDDSAVEEKPVSIRGRRAMSLSMDSHKLIPSFSRGVSKMPSNESEDGALSLSVLVASHQKRVVIHVQPSDTVAHAEEGVLSEMGKLAAELEGCHLFHPRNMTLMESYATLGSFELKDEDLLVFKDDGSDDKREEKKTEKSGGKSKGFFHRIRTSSKKDNASPPTSPSVPRNDGSSEEASGPLLLDHRIVKLYLQELKKRSAETEQGIFRVSGNAAVVNELRANIKQHGCDVQLEGIDTHELAGALKYYFRDIEEPVVPYEFYDRFLSAHCGSSVEHDTLKELVAELPDEHRKSLGMTISYLACVTAEAESNLMSADNVGIVFGPTLIRNKGEVIDLAKTGALADIVSFLLEHNTTIIDPADAGFDVDESDVSGSVVTDEDGMNVSTIGDAKDSDAIVDVEEAAPEIDSEGDEGDAGDDGHEDDSDDDSYDESGGGSDSTPREKPPKSGTASTREGAAANLQLAHRDEEDDEDEEEEENLEHESDEDGERAADVAALALAVAVAVQEQECPVAKFEDTTPRVEETIDAELDAVIFNLTVNPKEGAQLLLKLIKDTERCMELAATKSKLDLIGLLETVAESLSSVAV